jgi:predicted heme/steroid binding protein
MSKGIVISIAVVLLAVGIVFFIPDSVKDHDLIKSVTSHRLTLSLQEYSMIVWNYLKHLSTQAVTALTKKYPPEPRCLPRSERLFTPTTLKVYDGGPESSGKVYLAFLGVVYDVSRGIKHYGPDGTYHAFAGKDASRAFVTGEFRDVNKEGLLDDVSDLETSSFSGIKEWASFYEREYIKVGRVVGAYFDTEGCPTDKMKIVHEKYSKLEKEESNKKHIEQDYPPCNMEWSQDTKTTRLWCSSSSGGVNRKWIGRPKKITITETKETRCACIQTKEEKEAEDKREGKTGTEPKVEYEDDSLLIEDYQGCSSNSVQCLVQDQP